MEQKVDIAVSPATPRDFCVIGVGASAGGLEALRTLFSRMPAQPGVACVVVVHLSPEHESHLVQMLQPHTQMPVCQVVRTTVLERNRIYVIPPNANLDSIDTHLRLTQLEGQRIKRAPIDHFLRTLASTHGEQAIGVILSGAGSDGALGIRQIKEHGGLTLVQDPHEAEYGSMPQAAISTGTVDIVLPVRDMADEIAGYCATKPAVGDTNDVLSENESSLLEKILGEVRLQTGQEFAMFRREMVLQRVRRRMRVWHVVSLEAYFEVLKSHADEPRALHNDLLLNITEFFRDAELYCTIERMLGEILERKDKTGAQPRVRIWSIGCSTGEEAYSLAMLLIEHAAGRAYEQALQVFASELSSDALQQAREGLYPQEIAGSISPQRLERFFVQENGRYRVRRELRDMVTFANHDVFKDPPYSHLDLIVCRNLLRELEPAMRRGILNLFYYALEPHGILILDSDDQVEAADLFVRDPANAELLRRKGGPRRILQLPAALRPFARMSGERNSRMVLTANFDAPTIFRHAIERYTPPSVLVDASNRVVHYSATASRYVRIPGGELTVDILQLVPRTMKHTLRAGLRLVRRELRSWESEPLLVQVDGHARRVRLRIESALGPARATPLLLVVIDDTVASPAEVSAQEHGFLDQVLSLQAELDAVEGQLAVAAAAPGNGAHAHGREDQLRTTVEELDSAREELQAANEELISLNHENRYRIDALAQLSNDLQQLLESTGFAMVLLDRELRIVRFTPRAATLLRIKDSDAGRPLTDLKHHLRYEKLAYDLRQVLENAIEVEDEVAGEDDRWYLVHAQPYRTAHRGFEGVSLLLVDITDRKRAELALRASDRRKEEFLAVLAHELRNPLTPIVAGLEVLRRIPEDAALVQRVTNTMTRQAKQLTRLVDDLLEVERINEDKLTLRLHPVAIAEVVRDAVAATRPLLESLEHQLTLEMPEESLVIRGDGARLMQVIGNLLNNAARYTPRRGRITVSVRHEVEQVLISVRDNGRGLTPHALKGVFEMFYQEADLGVSGSGLGIGLALARKLVEMHGGTISAESAGAGTGSTFTVRLPLSQTVDAVSSPDIADTLEAAGAHRVLIVDDNTDAAEALRMLMKSLGGGDVQTAGNGPDALVAGAKLQPDLVLLDLGMPGMDGYELARRMRAESWGKEAMLVALTGWGQEHHRRRSHEAGFDRHVIKPADAATLRAVLSSCEAQTPA